jgi:hypothetical protein
MTLTEDYPVSRYNPNLTWQEIYAITEMLADNEWRVEICWKQGHNFAYPDQVHLVQEC